MDDGLDASLGSARYPAHFDLDMTNPDHYALMKAGLDAGGSKSIYFQENLTWRTKAEAGAYARRAQADWNTEPSDFARSNDTITIQPHVANGFVWRGSSWGNPWGGNSWTPSGVPKYPLAFQYATVDDPGTLKNFSFTPFCKWQKWICPGNDFRIRWHSFPGGLQFGGYRRGHEPGDTRRVWESEERF